MSVYSITTDTTTTVNHFTQNHSHTAPPSLVTPSVVLADSYDDTSNGIWVPSIRVTHGMLMKTQMQTLGWREIAEEEYGWSSEGLQDGIPGGLSAVC